MNPDLVAFLVQLVGDLVVVVLVANEESHGYRTSIRFVLPLGQDPAIGHRVDHVDGVVEGQYDELRDLFGVQAVRGRRRETGAVRPEASIRIARLQYHVTAIFVAVVVVEFVSPSDCGARY